MYSIVPVVVFDGSEIHTIALAKPMKNTHKTGQRDAHTGPRKNRPRRHSRGYGFYNPKQRSNWNPKKISE